ncbi:FecR family protein [Pedobacter caeni]|nr:FecR family protein [Pedobacter caeni]
MANQERLNSLIKQFTEGIISKEDYIELMDHFKKSEDTDPVYAAMDKVWEPERQRGNKHHTAEEMDALFIKLVSDKRFIKPRKVKLWPKIAIAASVVIAISAGLWFYMPQQRTGTMNSQTVGNNDIPPGHNTATLTLSSGRQIKLSDAKTGIVVNASKLTYNDGIAVEEAEPSRQLTITTPAGGTYQVHLSDGTKVWLNAASVFKFPASFNQSKYRKVEVIGEAYFEVAKDKAKPFVVTSAKQEVEVLGTHFNINSYANEHHIKTTLLEGSVRVSVPNSPISSFLKPGMQSTLTNSGINIQQLEDPKEAIAWQRGYFTFNRENLDQIMRKVSRWYDVSIDYKDEEVKQIPFSGTITRFTNVSMVLKMLELTGKVKFKIEGKNITVNRK